MILVGQYDSPFVRRVAVTLHHYHMPFTRNPLSVFGNAAKMKAINPLIRVPALILEDGETLIDSAAIIDYLDEKAGPARALTPAHGPERRRVLRTISVAAGCMDVMVRAFLERYFHPTHYQTSDWQKRGLKQIATALEYLDRECGAPWFIDSRMTQADVTVGCLLFYAKLRLPEVFPAGKYPHLHALTSHCEMRAEFVASRPGPDEAVPARKAKSSA